MIHSVLNIKPTSDTAFNFYKNHSTYHKGDSGLDLFLLEDIEIKCGDSKIIDLGIQCQMVEKNNNKTSEDVSYYLYPRSSMSKYPLILGNHVGIIDGGYRGNIKACIKYIITSEILEKILKSNKDSDINSTYEIPSLLLKKGERLFQLCSRNLEPFDIKIVEDLSVTQRGIGGFGSTDTLNRNNIIFPN